MPKNGHNPKSPSPGDLHIDATGVKVVDLTAEQIPAMSKIRDGYEAALVQLSRLPRELLDRAGIHPEEVARAVEHQEGLQEAHSFISSAEKMTELLRETRLYHGHHLAGILTEAAAQARRRAERDPKGDEILAALDELMAFQFGPAAKAAATREKAKKKIEKAKGDVA